MKNRLFVRMLAVLLLCALLPAASLADEEVFLFNKYPVDVDALKALEQEDSFAVRVTKKVVTDDVDSSSKLGNRDMLSLTVENKSEKTISTLVILAVAYDDDKKSSQLQNSDVGGVGYAGRAKRTISTLSFDTVSIAPGGFTILSTPCRHGYFTGVRVLVAQYTDSEGNTYTNPLYPEWQELALGSPTIILD